MREGRSSTRVVVGALLALLVLGGCSARGPGVVQLASTSRVEACSAPSSDTQSLLDGGHRFAWDLYTALKKPGENLFYSPFSVATALAMVFAGARSETAAEMATSLHFELEPDRFHTAYQALLADLSEERDGYQLSVGNSLWIQDGYPVLSAFLDLLGTHYGAVPGIVDFKLEAENARRAINLWVEEQTRGKIPDLFPAGSVNHLTRLALANAIYFKGRWDTPFDASRTQTAPFTLGSGEQVDAPLMFEKNEYGYLEKESFQALELPYRGQTLSMVILLPRPANGLKQLESSLSADQLVGTLSQLVKREVLVYLPRFEVSTSFSLNAALSALGVGRIFSEEADFSGIDGTHDLFVQAAIHRAFIEVSEEGTEAAAASGITLGVTSAAPIPPPVFRADHPFLFLIRNRESGQILFLGSLENPRG